MDMVQDSGGEAITESHPAAATDRRSGCVTMMIVDDQPFFRDAARQMLERDGGFQVVGEAEDGAPAVDMHARLKPDAVLMDVQMPEMDGLEAARRMLRQRPGARIVLMSMSGDSQYPVLAREIGAAAFIAKKNLTAGAVRGALGMGEPDVGQRLAA